MTGFIAMQREALEHPLLQDASRFRAWFWLVANAAWKETKFDIRGTTVPIARGQLCVSIRQIADEWGMSKSAADRFLTRLETETMIEREAGHGRLIITIRNYSKYQDNGEAERDTSGTPTGTPAGHRRDTKEQGNNTLPIGREKQKPRARARKGHRLPFDWQPQPLTGEIGETVAAWSPGALERELARFRDWAAAANGPNALKQNWQATWRNWLRKADDEGRHKRNGIHPYHPRSIDRRDGVARALDRRLGLGEPARDARRSDVEQGEGYRALAPPAPPTLR